MQSGITLERKGLSFPNSAERKTRTTKAEEKPPCTFQGTMGPEQPWPRAYTKGRAAGLLGIVISGNGRAEGRAQRPGKDKWARGGRVGAPYGAGWMRHGGVLGGRDLSGRDLISSSEGPAEPAAGAQTRPPPRSASHATGGDTRQGLIAELQMYTAGTEAKRLQRHTGSRCDGTGLSPWCGRPGSVCFMYFAHLCFLN